MGGITMAQLAIRGHATRGKEIIELLEMLGGINKYRINFTDENLLYTIREGDDAIIATYPNSSISKIFSIEEFLEKFPYKVGDKVIDKTDECIGIVTEMCWEEHTSCIKYCVTFGGGVDFGWYLAQSLQPYKEETMEEITVNIPKGYEFAGIDDNRQQVVFTKIQPEYPTTYEECCKVLGYSGNYNMILTTDVDNKLFNALYRLKVSRDAYWEIAGEWKPNFTNQEEKFIIANYHGKVYQAVATNYNRVLVFPTEEMRDAFYENFKELIEQCKELL